jgi:hypothetical protein
MPEYVEDDMFGEEPKIIKVAFKVDPNLKDFDIEKIYVMRDFIRYCVSVLGIKGKVIINLRNDKDPHLQTLASYSYDPNGDEIYIRAGRRHIVDIMRSVAHELIHKKQHEKGQLNDDSGKTGSPQENEANAGAGIIMRDYTSKNRFILDII